jgi:LysM repeat protein
MQLKIKLIAFFCLIQFFASASVDDSTGVILKNGKVYILHKIEAGQGLFGVARRYKTVWTSVRDANPGSDKQLLPGQIVLVPTGKTEKQFFGNKTPKYAKNAAQYNKPEKTIAPEKEKPADNSNSNSSPKTSFTLYYTVKKGETLFSIAEKFGTTVDFLKQLNKLYNEKLEVGKDILVPMTDEKDADVIIAQKEAEAKKLKKELDEITEKIEEEKKNQKTEATENTEKPKKEETNENLDKTENNENTKDNGKKSESEPVKDGDVKSIVTTEYSIVTENFPEFDVEKITETGYAKLMNDPNIDQTKDWVLHHNAPENTLILITNPNNNKTVYVKVVKNFTRKDNDSLIIQLTKKTADDLELNKKDKFAIKISFAK